jgi:hypothetical protein
VASNIDSAITIRFSISASDARACSYFSCIYIVVGVNSERKRQNVKMRTDQLKSDIKGSGALLGGEGAQLLNRARYYGRKDILNHIKSVLHLF